MLPNVGMGELVIILVIVLVLFGAKRLPEVAKGLGRSVKAFKEGMDEGTHTTDKKESDTPAAKS
jgi:sec-independent protein translocase protein TatA